MKSLRKPESAMGVREECNFCNITCSLRPIGQKSAQMREEASDQPCCSAPELELQAAPRGSKERLRCRARARSDGGAGPPHGRATLRDLKGQRGCGGEARKSRQRQGRQRVTHRAGLPGAGGEQRSQLWRDRGEASKRGGGKRSLLWKEREETSKHPAGS